MLEEEGKVLEMKEAVAFLLNDDDDDDGDHTSLLLQALTTLHTFLNNCSSSSSAGKKATASSDRGDPNECNFLRRQSLGPATFAATSSSVRNVLSPLGVNGDRGWQQLTHRLTVGMERRVDTNSLLPLTQDLDANNEAMKENSARTLTHTSLTAATVYAQLLAKHGALAVGLVEMNAVSALSNVRRHQ